MITFAEHVLVPHPPAVVWSVLSDPEKVVTCVDGSRIGDYHDDGTFDAFLTVKFAGIKVAFKALATLTLDAEGLAGRLEGKGGDGRGSTRVTGGADFSVVPDGDGSIVTLDGSADVKGPLAGLVTTGASLVVSRMARSFTAKLITTCNEIAGAGVNGSSASAES